MRRSRRDEEDDDHETLWHELAERACHIPGSRERSYPGDAHRYVHHDVERLDDGDLALEKYRAIFRVCFERDTPNLWWLLRRIGRIEHEQEQRATAEREMAARARREAQPTLSPALDRQRLHALSEEAARARERAAHAAWLAYQDEQERTRERAAHQAWLDEQVEQEPQAVVAD